MKQYEGRRTNQGVEITVDNNPVDARLDLRNHSPTGFEWGYEGSGAAQLALAILADCVGDELAVQYYQGFKRRIVASLADKGWTLSEEEIRETISSLQQERGRS